MACSWTLAGLATAETAQIASRSAWPDIIVNNAAEFGEISGSIALNY
jgi:hypothetical protein